MKTHVLKCWPPFYEDTASGDKLFELRKDDRPFSLGDLVVLLEYIPKEERYTGYAHVARIKYILREAESWGLKKGYCILSVGPIAIR